MKASIPHGHITKKLRRSLIIIIGLGIIMTALLGSSIFLINYNIDQTAIRSKQIAISNFNALLQAQQKFALPEDTSYVPTALDDATLVNVIAKNQPSVVRIVTIYCADITLTSSRATANFTDTCTGKVGSGSFISSDGYIATNGHVTTIMPANAVVDSLATSEDISKYLDYLVSSRLISFHDGAVIKNGFNNQNAEAQQWLEATIDLIPTAQVSAVNDTINYAIQLSNNPVRIDRSGDRLVLEYGDTVVKASLIDQDYDQLTSDQALTTGEFTSSDVALLKASGSFPYISLGNIDKLKIGDQLTAIGFPTSVSGVSSDLTQKVPSITQGKVTAITNDAPVDGRKLIATTVQIGQGNSGGPALNDAGQQIGLNTYSALECPDLKCTGDGQVRDIADIKALLTKHNITLKTGGVSDDWARGLDAYVKGNYTDALKYFTKVQDEYPANYLVPSLLSVAKQQVGSQTDASMSYQAQGLVVIALIVLAALIPTIAVILIILIVIFTKRYHRQMRNQKSLM